MKDKEGTELMCERIMVIIFQSCRKISSHGISNTIHPQIMNRINTAPPHFTANPPKTRKKESYKQPEEKRPTLLRR